MLVTRQLQCITEQIKDIQSICRTTGFMRSDIWRRFGALKNYNQSNSDIRKHINALSMYKNLTVDGTIRSETTKDIVNDILLYKEAAKTKVRKSIYKRTCDKQEQKRLYTLLKKDEWLQDNFLHRQMRKHFKHGKSKTDNQFVVRSDKHSSYINEKGNLVVIIHRAKKYGKNIELITRSNGKNISLEGKNLRIIVENEQVNIHYSTEKQEGRISGEKTIALDKAYKVSFVDSEGDFHGQKFGKTMTEFSDKISDTGKKRNKLYALEKKYRKEGKIQKADRIKQNNLGKIKLNSRTKKAKAKLKNIAYKSAHKIADKAGIVITEDLTSPISKKKSWKKYNRRMNNWAKGILAQAIDEVCQQRNVKHYLVNAAYTSQMDNRSGLLEGKREGEKFYHINGDVSHADVNAAKNILARLYDKEIGLYTSFKEVKKILLKRSSDETDRQKAQVANVSLSTECGLVLNVNDQL